jgi:hypothetical protein
MNGLEIFFTLFGVSVESWHLSTFFADIRHQTALLASIGGDCIDPIIAADMST